jgi:WD40 repeat protein
VLDVVAQVGGPIVDAAATPDGGRAYHAVGDPVGVVGLSSGDSVATLAHDAAVADVAVADDGTTLVATADGRALLWPPDGGSARDLPIGDNAGADLSADGARVVVAGSDGRARILDAATGRELRVLEALGGRLTGAWFSRDASLVVTTSGDRTARIYDAATGALVHQLEGHRDDVVSASFSSGGRRLVTASLDHDARVWDVASGRLLHVLRGHFAALATAAFSPDGRWIVTAGPTAAGLWDASTGRLVTYLRGHTAPLAWASFALQATILTAGADGTLRRAACTVCLPLEELVDLAEAKLASVGRASGEPAGTAFGSPSAERSG